MRLLLEAQNLGRDDWQVVGQIQFVPGKAR